MSFHELNGWAIPTKLGGSAINTEFGNRTSAFDGSRRRSLIALKRDLELTTVRTKEMTSEAYRGAILGLGLLFHYDTDYYSTNGLYPSGTPIYTIESSTGADGDPVKVAIRTGAAAYVFRDQVYFGTGCLGAFDDTTNLLTADQRDCENGTTGFVANNGGALASNAVHYWQQTKSIRCITVSAALDGIVTNPNYNPGGGSDGKTYTASVYVKGDAGGEVLKFYISDNDNANNTNQTFTLTDADTWYRLQVTHTISGGDTTSVALLLANNAVSVITFYVDGWQFEEKPHMTSWYDGARGGNQQLYYATTEFNNDVTFNFWTLGPPYDHSGLSLPVAVYKDISDRIFMYSTYDAGTNFIKLRSDVAGVADDLTHSTVWDGTWKMITGVIRRNPETGESNARIYEDGVSVANDDLTGFSTETFDTVEIGNYGNTSDYPCGYLDDVQVLPYAATTAQILAWYNMGKAMSDLPKLYLTGDCIPETERVVIGEVKGTKYESFQGDSVFHNNAAVHNFILREE